jgi:hypothetical protein
MPLLQIRDCPQDIYTKLTEAAHRERRTIAQQALVLLETSLEQKPEPLGWWERKGACLMKQIAEEAKFIPEAAKKADDVKWIREDRNR